jgi:hypothetical protein
MSKKTLKKQNKQKWTNKKRYLLIVGIVAVVVVVSILLHTMLANREPAIISLGAPEKVLPLESCQITCHATDPDGNSDELTYDWSATAGEITGEGATVNWTAPDSAGSYKVTVTVADPRGGQVVSHVTITVGSPPIIAGLVAATDWVTPSGSVQVTCNATDPEGGELTYQWTATAGNISGADAAVNWTAPQEAGIYDITVVVKDVDGGSATDSLHIIVATEQPPVIAALLITKDRYDHCYLKKSGEKYLVGREQNYDIECIVSDTAGELSYEWSCTAGELSGDGSLVTWTAPDAVVEVTVTARVSDIVGNMASMDLILSVVSCSRCTFGC